MLISLIGAIASSGAAGPVNTTGKYWYNTQSGTYWTTLSSWFTNYNHTINAASLPASSTDAVIRGTSYPIIDLDDVSWIEPNSINAGTFGVEITSQNNATINCSISGSPIIFSGNAQFGN